MNYIRLFSVGLVCLSLWSCREDKLSSDARTGFCISLTEADETVETRSTPKELGKPAVDQFKLKIVSCTTGDAIYEDGYTSDFIPALTDVYDVTASFGDNAVLAYDAPYYEGKKEDVAVEEKKITSLEVECTVANALASVTFDQPEKFEALYSSYVLEVSVDKFSLELNGTDGKSAYYRANSKPTFTFKGVLKETGKSVEAVLENEVLDDPATFAAKAHCRLTLALKDMVPGVIPTITKAEVETVTVSETLPMEWLPAPKVSATGFDESNTVSVYETGETDTASIDFSVALSLQDLSFTLNFADENLQSLNKTYQLSTMTEDEKQNFKDAGITLPQIGSANPRMIFPKEFISTLHSSNEGTVTNTLTINSVKANDRENVDAQIYTINVHKPEFTVSVLPGNIWTKEFTVEEITVEEGKGNLEEIKKSLVYQYQENGEWKDCNNQASRQQVFADHPLTRNYKVRALYRETLASNEVDVEMEEPKALPNGNMDEWIPSTRYNQPYYQPWSNEAWWDSNNNVTMPKSYSVYPNYKCFPTTTYTEAGVSGKAAVIRSVAVNGANSEIMGAGENRGILYIGSTSDDGTMTEGREWNSRPSKLTFMYQYESYDNEHFGAYIELLSEDGIVIASEQFLSTAGVSVSSYEKAEIMLNYINSSLKASKIQIRFVSVADGESVNTRKQTISIPAGSYKIYGGSVLTIDDISLVYDK